MEFLSTQFQVAVEDFLVFNDEKDKKFAIFQSITGVL
jgi:hypothetical protein